MTTLINNLFLEPWQINNFQLDIAQFTTLFHIFIMLASACVIHLSLLSGGEFHFTTAITIIPPREVVEIRTALSETACKPKPAQQPLFSVLKPKQNRFSTHVCIAQKKQTSSSSSASQAGNIPSGSSVSSSWSVYKFPMKSKVVLCMYYSQAF